MRTVLKLEEKTDAQSATETGESNKQSGRKEAISINLAYSGLIFKAMSKKEGDNETVDCQDSRNDDRTEPFQS